MLQIAVDKGSRQPIYRQMAETLRERILSGEIAAASRLPATRTLASRCGVHRNTVIAAYRFLEKEGLVRSVVGAGTFVAGEADGLSRGLRLRAPEPPGGESPFSWRRLLRDPARLEPDTVERFRLDQLSVPPAPILLNGVLPDRRQFPMDEFTTCVQEVLAEGDPRLLEYGPPEGDEGLRKWILGSLAQSGVAGVDLRRVFIVSGSQQGIDLLARLLLAPGDGVALEEPTYTGAFTVLRHAGARLLTVPMDADGIVPDALAAVLDRDPVKFLYTMPCYQNPTGLSQSAARKGELLALARRRGLAIIEDHYDTPLHYDGRSRRPLLADETAGQVIHLGTFSKILFPGLRLGWMVLPDELCTPLRRLRWAADLASGTLTQRVMERFCSSGRLARHLDHMRRVNRRRLQAMLQSIEAEFPPEARWTRPAGGMTLWVELPEGIDCVELLHAAAPRGVLFTPGAAFYPNGGGRSAMRLSFNREGEARIRRGIRLLGELIEEYKRTRRRSKTPRRDLVPFL